MPFVLLFTGVLLLTVSIRNQQTPFVQLVGGDFRGQGNFLYWLVALIVIGAIGYIPKAKPVSNLLLVLILVVLVLKRGNPAIGTTGGVFKQLTAALGTTQSSAPSAGALATTATTAAGNILNTAVGGQ